MLAAVTIVVAGFATGLWARSYWVSDFIEFTTASHSSSLKAVAGDIVWTKIEMPLPGPYGWECGNRAADSEREIVNKQGLLRRDSLFFRFADVTPTNNTFRIKTAAVPFWWWDVPLVILAFVLACVWLKLRRHTSRVESANVVGSAAGAGSAKTGSSE
jgi:hypothetical protein